MERPPVLERTWITDLERRPVLERRDLEIIVMTLPTALGIIVMTAGAGATASLITPWRW